ncbi:MAG: hypothetical protein QW794_00465 [Thermosphaera sp.]
MSYLVVSCKHCSGRKIISLKGRFLPYFTRCPYCGVWINLRETHFAIFDDYRRARDYWLKGLRDKPVRRKA